jgi:hypothetical protein
MAVLLPTTEFARSQLSTSSSAFELVLLLVIWCVAFSSFFPFATAIDPVFPPLLQANFMNLESSQSWKLKMMMRTYGWVRLFFLYCFKNCVADFATSLFTDL